MNMFRNLIAVFCLGVGLALYFLKEEQWSWLNIAGPDVMWWLDFMYKAEPFSTIIFVVLAVALFMTRKIY